MDDKPDATKIPSSYQTILKSTAVSLYEITAQESAKMRVEWEI